MRYLSTISNEFKQKFLVNTEDNKVFTLQLEFIENQQSWNYSIIYNNFSINKKRLTTHPNFLRQFVNFLPFGLACETSDNGEPFAIDDFTTGRVKIYLLTQSECQEIEVFYA